MSAWMEQPLPRTRTISAFRQVSRLFPCSKSVIANLLKHQTCSVNQSGTRKAKPTRACSSERAPTLTTVNKIVKIKCYQCTGNVTEPKKKNHPEPICSKTRPFQQSKLKHHLLMACKGRLTLFPDSTNYYGVCQFVWKTRGVSMRLVSWLSLCNNMKCIPDHLQCMCIYIIYHNRHIPLPFPSSSGFQQTAPCPITFLHPLACSFCWRMKGCLLFSIQSIYLPKLWNIQISRKKYANWQSVKWRCERVYETKLFFVRRCRK